MAIAEREPHTAPTPPYFPQATTWEPYQQTLAERWYVMPMQSAFSLQSAWGVGGVLASGSCRCGGEGAEVQDKELGGRGRRQGKRGYVLALWAG